LVAYLRVGVVLVVVGVVVAVEKPVAEG